MQSTVSSASEGLAPLRFVCSAIFEKILVTLLMIKLSKRKIVIPRAPIKNIKPEQVHKSAKDYDRTKVRKEIREIMKEIKKPAN